MKDAELLARRLGALVGIVAAGCTHVDAKPESAPTGSAAASASASAATPPPTATNTATTTTTVAATTSASSATPDADGGRPRPPFPQFGFRCDPIPWCGTAAQATAAKKDGTDARLGCPTSLQNVQGQRTLPEYPAPFWSYAELDDRATADQRHDAGKRDECCYAVHRMCGGGRAWLDAAGEPVVPAVREGADVPGRASPLTPLSVSAEVRDAIARGWLRDALAEHASIAAFARAALELLALGAPASLIEGCHLAALDEVRHARVCFALATAWLGREVSAGPLPALPPRETSFVELARNTFLEGCVGETVAALVALRASEACVDPQVRAALAAIAADEERHAALAFRTVAYAVEAGGAPVIEALLAASREGVPAIAIATSPAPSSRTAILAAHGRLDDDAVAACAHDAWHATILPLLRALLASKHAAR